jgi:putative ABC transport system permease protein
MMFLNFIKQFFRIQKREKLYSLISTLGLSMGIAVFLIVALFVKHEYSYDKHLGNAENIVMFMSEITHFDGQSYTFATGSAPMGPGFTNEVPGIKSFLRVLEQNREAVISYEEKSFLETSIARADSTLFEYFDLELIYGDPKTALTEPNSVVLSEETAIKYFGDEDPLGKTIVHDGRFTYNVTGVYRPSNRPSNLKAFPLFVSLSTLQGIDDGIWTQNMRYKLYFMLENDQTVASLERTMEATLEKYSVETGWDTKGAFEVSLIEIKKLHLDPDAVSKYFGESNNSAVYVNQFMIVGIFILSISILNFINLSTARGASRSNFVGITKTFGATRNSLVKRFIFESILVTSISTVFALIFVEMVLPYISILLSKNLEFQFLEKSWHWVVISIFTLVLGVASGFYPAIILSKQKPVKVLYSGGLSSYKKSRLRSVLVMTQFAIVIILIAGSLIIGNQMNYLFEKDLGYTKDQILSVRMGNWDQMTRSQSLLNQVSKLPEVESVTYADFTLLDTITDRLFHVPGQPDDSQQLCYCLPIDHNFMNTFEMELVAGRGFDINLASDSSQAIILNETAVQELGYEDPIGKIVEIMEERSPLRFSKWEIIGVVKDYNFKSLHHEIAPLSMNVIHGYPVYHFYKINTSHVQETIRKIESIWEDFAPGFPIQYTFMDEKYDRLYHAEKQMMTLFNYLTTISILIACMGLFALITYSAQQRTKEIGIRKVLGASVISLVYLLVKEFLLLVVIAFVLACPIAYLIMDKWLANFAFQTDINAIPFVTAGVLAGLIALIVVVSRAISAANRNPITAIKWE